MSGSDRNRQLLLKFLAHRRNEHFANVESALVGLALSILIPIDSAIPSLRVIGAHPSQNHVVADSPRTVDASPPPG